MSEEITNIENENTNTTPEVTPVIDPVVTSKLDSLEQKLSNPEYMKSLLGIAPAPVQQDQATNQPPKFDPIDTENLTTAQVLEEQQRRTVELMNWQAEQFNKQLAVRDDRAMNEKRQQEMQQEIERVKSFVASKKDFNELKPDIEKLYNGGMSIEASYELVKLRKENETLKKNPQPVRSPLQASTTVDGSGLTKKFDTIEDGAKAALDEVLGMTNPGFTL